jgi:hypothetical protein
MDYNLSGLLHHEGEFISALEQHSVLVEKARVTVYVYQQTTA